jgi:hypothetical protein
LKTQTLKKNYSRLIFGVVIFGILVFASVCWHSVEEIHYLKSFFPKQFSVQEAYYAAAIELIKVVIIGLPIVFIVWISLYLWSHRDMEN